MSERRVGGAARAGRAASLVLLGVVLGSAGSKMVRASGQEGACPRCGEAFTLAHVRDVWNKHTP